MSSHGEISAFEQRHQLQLLEEGYSCAATLDLVIYRAYVRYKVCPTLLRHSLHAVVSSPLASPTSSPCYTPFENTTSCGSGSATHASTSLPLSAQRHHSRDHLRASLLSQFLPLLVQLRKSATCLLCPQFQEQKTYDHLHTRQTLRRGSRSGSAILAAIRRHNHDGITDDDIDAIPTSRQGASQSIKDGLGLFADVLAHAGIFGFDERDCMREAGLQRAVVEGRKRGKG